MKGFVQQVKDDVKYCIEQLFQRFWVIKQEDEELFYQITDNEAELKKFFRDTFHYRLIITYDMIKLEKIPAQAHAWMGEKTINGTSVFKKQRDYVFFFCFLAFLEGKNKEQQFTLKNICESIQAYYPSGETIEWKEGTGYQNRLSLVRILKFAVKYQLVIVIDQQIDDFAADANHDVLLQRTAYSSYFVRNFQEDVTGWRDFSEFEHYLDQENHELAERKHRYYRRLFLEPVVYHHEISGEEADYVNNYYHAIENLIGQHTDYRYERYRHNSMLVRQAYRLGDVCHPTDAMVAKLSMLAAKYILDHPDRFPMQFYNEVEVSTEQIDAMLDQLRTRHRKNWTQKFRQSSAAELRNELLIYLQMWNFAAAVDEHTWKLKEGLFRMAGYYTEPVTQGENAI